MAYPKQQYNLRDIIDDLVSRYASIETVVLFGSRNHRTASDRSDVDLILKHNSHIKPLELRNLTEELCPALDLFLCRDGVAVSCANESSVSAANFDELVSKLDGTTLWTAVNGFNSDFGEWDFEIPLGVDFVPTAAILSFEQYESWAPRIRDFMKGVEAAGYPTNPYVGSTPKDIAEAMISALTNAVSLLPTLDPRGKNSQIQLLNEYDFQNLFHVICKPWFAQLAREEVTIHYDGQDKIADFNFLNNRLVFEFKHIRKNNGRDNKAAVLKTLAGLTDFYVRHPNIAILVNVLLVDCDVDLDDKRIEDDHSFRARTPEVWTKVVRNGT